MWYRSFIWIAVATLWPLTGCVSVRDIREPMTSTTAGGEASASRYLAFSLSEAQARLARGDSTREELTTIAGVNIIAGGVYDQSRRDIILVGQRVPQQPSATLDDLAVALRTIVAQGTVPQLALTLLRRTPVTGLQVVRFQGALPDTQFGLDFLKADILLKEKLSLRTDPLPGHDLKSYLELAAEHRANRLADDGLRVGTRLWFNLSAETRLVKRSGAAVFAVENLPIIVEKVVMWVSLGGKPAENAESIGDPAADAAARTLTKSMNELCDEYPTLARLRGLFSLAAVARGMGDIVPREELRYWPRNIR